MTTLREAAQLALEALERGLPIIEDFGGKEQLPLQHKAIAVLYEALRAALAQPEQEPVATLFGSLPVYDVPTKQEPVAWMHNFIDEVVIAHRPADLDRHPDRWTALYKDPPPCQTCEALARTVMMDQPYHDSVMAQREWQGLTPEDKRIAGIPLYTDQMSISDAFDVIERILKEKNHDMP